MHLRIVLLNVGSLRHLSTNSCDSLAEGCLGVLTPLYFWDEAEPGLSGPPGLKRKARGRRAGRPLR